MNRIMAPRPLPDQPGPDRETPRPPPRVTWASDGATKWQPAPPVESTKQPPSSAGRPPRARSTLRRPRQRPGHGSRRRLRRPVRPAHRPPRPRGTGLQRDRPQHDAGGRDARQGPEGDHPLRWPVLRVRGGCPAPGRRQGALRRRGPRLRHVLRLPADGDHPRRHRRQHRRPRVRPYAARRLQERLHPLRGHPREPVGVDVPRRRLLRRPRGLQRHRVDERRPGRGLRERRGRSCTACSTTPR